MTAHTVCCLNTKNEETKNEEEPIMNDWYGFMMGG